jgi:hypothetical protein
MPDLSPTERCAAAGGRVTDPMAVPEAAVQKAGEEHPKAAANRQVERMVAKKTVRNRRTEEA